MKAEPVSAYDAAESLLRGYALQDVRMDHLMNGEYEEAKAAEEQALEEMAEAFQYEFPESDQAASAGRHFMQASFKQDEIENWEVLNSDPEVKKYTKVSDLDDRESFSTDPRWEEVEEELKAVCEAAGIDEEYVREKKKFLKLHEKGDPRYKEHAARAEEVKIKAMIDDEHEDKARDLSEYFLKGVEMHDQWDAHGELDEDVVQLVGEYYKKIDSLRN